MRVLFVGDIIGEHGRKSVARHLPRLKSSLGVDFAIVNAENAAHGYGLTLSCANELLQSGADCLSGGNHTFDKKDIFALFDHYALLRPANLPKAAPGRGQILLEKEGKKLGVACIMGHFGMPVADNMLYAASQCADELSSAGAQAIIVDIHAEATSEKQALFLHLGSSVSAIIGTHTHVGTDDLLIRDGTAFLCDIGLTGCRDHVIGVDSDAPIKRLLTGIPQRFEMPKKCRTIFQALFMEFDENGRCIDAKKYKAYDNEESFVSMQAFYERL